MRREFPLVKRTVEKIADGGPNIPLWNLIGFGGPHLNHHISTSDVNQFKTAIQALALCGGNFKAMVLTGNSNSYSKFN